MNRERLEEQKEDIELTLALLEDWEAEGAALGEWEKQLAADPLYQKPLPRLKYRMGSRKKICGNIHITRKRVMLFTLIIILSVSLLAGSVSGAITVFYDWIAHGSRTAVSIRSGEGLTGMEWDWSGYYRPEVPEGFALSNVESEGDVTIFIYSNGEERFTLWQIKGGWGSLQDSEHSEPMEEVKVNGQPGFLFQEGKSIRLVWGKNPRFTLYGELAEEELFQIAESVKYVP